MTCSSVIRVATIHSKEMGILMKEDGRMELSGIEGKFLKLILESLKLSLEIVIAKDGEWGRLLPNGSWTGMIGEIQQNNADIAINHIGITEPRTQVVDFSTAYFTDDVTFAIEKQGFASTSTALIRPFAWNFWIVMFTVLFLMALLFRFLLFTKRSYLHILLKMLGAILKQSFSCKDNNFTHRILLMTWLIYAMIISFSYSSVLFSMLSIPSHIPTVKNFDELSDAAISRNYKVLIYNGTFLMDYFLQHERKPLRLIIQSCIRNNWVMSSNNMSSTPQINKQSAMLAARVLLQMVIGPEELEWHLLSDDINLTYKFAIAMKKGFCHKKRLNRLISRINSAGLYFKIINDRIFQLWLSNPETSRAIHVTVRPLSYTDLIGIFASYLVGLSISFLVLITETACVRFLQ